MASLGERLLPGWTRGHSVRGGLARWPRLPWLRPPAAQGPRCRLFAPGTRRPSLTVLPLLWRKTVLNRGTRCRRVSALTSPEGLSSEHPSLPGVESGLTEEQHSESFKTMWSVGSDFTRAGKQTHAQAGTRWTSPPC